jgi:hypothetical protein
MLYSRRLHLRLRPSFEEAQAKISGDSETRVSLEDGESKHALVGFAEVVTPVAAGLVHAPTVYMEHMHIYRLRRTESDDVSAMLMWLF